MTNRLILEAMSLDNLETLFPNYGIPSILKYIEKVKMDTIETYEFLENVELKVPLLVKIISLMKKDILKKDEETKNLNQFVQIETRYDMIRILLYMSFLLQNKNLMNNLDPDEKEYIQKFNNLKTYQEMIEWFQAFPYDKVYNIILGKYYGDLKYEPIYKNVEYAIYHMTNYVIARKLGGDTKWCVSSPTSGKENFLDYESRGYSLYALIYKDQYEKYLLAIASKSEIDPDETDYNFEEMWKIQTMYYRLLRRIKNPQEVVYNFWDEVLLNAKAEVEKTFAPINIVDNVVQELKTNNISMDRIVEETASVLLHPKNIKEIINIFKSTNINPLEKIINNAVIQILKNLFPNLNESEIMSLNGVLGHLFYITTHRVKPFNNEKDMSYLIKDIVEEQYFSNLDYFEDINEIIVSFDESDSSKFTVQNINSYLFELKDREDNEVNEEDLIRILDAYKKATPEPRNFVEEYYEISGNLGIVKERYDILRVSLVEDSQSYMDDIIDEIKKSIDDKRISFLTFLKNHEIYNNFFRWMTKNLPKEFYANRHHIIFQHPIFKKKLEDFVQAFLITNSELEDLKYHLKYYDYSAIKCLLLEIVSTLERKNGKT